MIRISYDGRNFLLNESLMFFLEALGTLSDGTQKKCFGGIFKASWEVFQNC